MANETLCDAIEDEKLRYDMSRILAGLTEEGQSHFILATSRMKGHPNPEFAKWAFKHFLKIEDPYQAAKVIAKVAEKYNMIDVAIGTLEHAKYYFEAAKVAKNHHKPEIAKQMYAKAVDFYEKQGKFACMAEAEEALGRFADAMKHYEMGSKESDNTVPLAFSDMYTVSAAQCAKKANLDDEAERLYTILIEKREKEWNFEQAMRSSADAGLWERAMVNAEKAGEWEYARDYARRAGLDGQVELYINIGKMLNNVHPFAREIREIKWAGG